MFQKCRWSQSSNPTPPPPKKNPKTREAGWLLVEKEPSIWHARGRRDQRELFQALETGYFAHFTEPALPILFLHHTPVLPQMLSPPGSLSKATAQVRPGYAETRASSAGEDANCYGKLVGSQAISEVLQAPWASCCPPWRGSLSYFPLLSHQPQNHRMFEVGRDLCGSSGPTLLPKQGHLQQAAEDRVQAGLEYLQRRRLHNLPGQPVPGLHHPQSEEVLPHVQTETPSPPVHPRGKRTTAGKAVCHGSTKMFTTEKYRKSILTCSRSCALALALHYPYVYQKHHLRHRYWKSRTSKDGRGLLPQAIKRVLAISSHSTWVVLVRRSWL